MMYFFRKKIRMPEFFTIEEMTRSSVARRKKIDNTPPQPAAAALADLIENLLDPIRRMWGAPIAVNSGYRCPELNRAVGGAASSQHLRGEAADITTGSQDGNRRLFDMIAGGSLEFDQLIDERGYSWLHISYRKGANRRNTLHL